MPWTRARVHWQFIRRQSYVQWPLYGHVLEAFKEGRLEIDQNVTLLAGCWLSLPGDARIHIGRGVYINGNAMIHAYERIEIGEFTLVSRGALITDAIHRTEDPELPVQLQGMQVKGPTIIGRNVWIGANAAIMSGVTIGDRAVVGANSVVTRDVEPAMIVAGVPARVIRRIDFTQDLGMNRSRPSE